MSFADRLKEPHRRAKVFKARPELLLQNNTVKPLHGVVPRIILGQDWWDATRKAAYRSTNWRCAACGVASVDAREKQALEGHEVYDVNYAAGRQVYIETVALCHYCHCFIHDGRLKALIQTGEVSPAKYNKVMAHGRKVLRTAGIARRPVYSGPLAEWQDWRLVICGKEYPPVHATYEDWLKHFGHVKERID